MEGVPVSEIKDIYGVTREAIYQKLRRAEGWEGIKKHHSKLRSRERLSELYEHSKEIAEGWLAGVSMADLAREFKTSRKNISDIVKQEMGSTKRRYKRDLKIVEKYRDGKTQVELAKEYGISQSCISRIVNALYIEITT